jgi:hypothetical protein
MRKTTRRQPKRSAVKRSKDLPAGAKAATVKAGLTSKLQPAVVKSWSTSGDA